MVMLTIVKREMNMKRFSLREIVTILEKGEHLRKLLDLPRVNL